ncbi:unnamed protein product [Prorocentrum cordatum]|uniref:Uncharacterized protein n=1 Tax=Prorocentrum cordatum TaxID=2364126 RepID=A0ABN9XIZ4_9DINO|nr:unnamed protein product [Polarella glacialis]
MTKVMKTPTVPTWNGSAGTWEKYQQDVMNYVDGTKWEDRYLCGPRLDVGHCMKEYFVKLRRRRGEGMAEYCLRVHESYQRLRVALARMVRKNGKDQFIPDTAMRKHLKCETGKFPKLSGTDRCGTATADGRTGGLDGGEIAAVIGSCRGDFTVDNVESALRTQWPSDENLKDKDYRKSKFIRQQVIAAAFYGDDVQTWGDGGHRTGSCPDKADPKLSQNRPAPGRGGGDGGAKLHGFILMAEYDARSDDETELQVEELGSVVDFDDPEVRMAYIVERATENGHGIMDCGATKTIGGIEAVETLNEILISRGHPPMEVDLQDRPVYKFGNGEVKRVLCRVKFTLLVQGEYVSFFVHAIDAKGIPILVSIETLNSLGAIVDFDAACGIFKKIDPFRMISFPRSRTGHLLIDLTCDLLGGTVLKYIYWLTEDLYGISNRIYGDTEQVYGSTVYLYGIS